MTQEFALISLDFENAKHYFNTMISQRDSLYIRAAWGFIIVFTIVRLIYSGFFLLTPDEANHWQWGRHLAWGYHDQAPMTGWIIRFSTFIIGQTETGVRLPSVLAMAAISAYMLLIALKWIGPKAAFNTAILANSILVFNVGGLLATPDSLQAVAWAGASYHVACAYEKGAWFQWLMGGVWFGFGMLSKYTMVIFLPGVLVFGLLSQNHRNRLTSVRPWTGVILGTLMFFPVIYWNAVNNWNSLRHVAYIGGANEAFSIHLKYFLNYVASQSALLSPLVFLLVLGAWVLVLLKGYRRLEWIYLYLALTSLPMVTGFALLSLHTRVYGNWPSAGYFTAAILVAALFGGNSQKVLKKTKPSIGQKIWPWAVGSSYAITAFILIQAVWPIFPIPTKWDRTINEISGWRDLGKKAGEVLKAMPNPEKTFLFGLRYQTASELAFYTPGQPRTVSINRWNRPNVYDYWWKDKDIIGWDAVGVTGAPDSHKTILNQVFDRVTGPIKVPVFRTGPFLRVESSEKPAKIFYLYRAHGFKGGLVWVPPTGSDIRAN